MNFNIKSNTFWIWGLPSIRLSSVYYGMFKYCLIQWYKTAKGNDIGLCLLRYVILFPPSLFSLVSVLSEGCIWVRDIQYIPRNMHTVFALLCFVVVMHWLIFPYPSGLLYWHCGNLRIAPVPAKQLWRIWINTSCEFIMNDCITTTKQAQQNRVHISWDILYSKWYQSPWEEMRNVDNVIVMNHLRFIYLPNDIS